ncbi:hypothetical protein ACXR2T_07615 [Leucobacter sp. HY1910]
MSNAETSPPSLPPGTAQRAPARKKMYAILAGVAALAIGGGVGIPAIVHAHQVSNYHSTVESLHAVSIQSASDESTSQAVVELHKITQPAAYSLAEKLNALADQGEPTFTSADAKAIKKAVTDAKIEQASAPKESALQSAFDKQVQSDADAAAAAKRADKPAPDPTVPAHIIDLSVDQAIELLDISSKPVPAKKVADHEVNGKVVDSVRTELAKAEKSAADAAKEAQASQALIEAVDAQVGSLRSALSAAAKSAPAQAKTSIEMFAKAPQSDKDAVTKAAKKAAQLHETEEATTSELYEAVQTYANAVARAKTSHDAKVVEETVAAEAAAERAEQLTGASDGSGYGDSSGYSEFSDYIDYGTGSSGAGTGSGGSGGTGSGGSAGSGGAGTGAGGTGSGGAGSGGNGGSGGGPVTSCPPGTSWTGQYDGNGNYYCGTWDEIGW